MTPSASDRYQRHLLLPELGWEGQAKLQAGRVLVVGAGGLGCPVLQYLAAAGVGTLGIVDPDVVSLSNLQRQVLYTTASVGQLKTEAARAALHALNPEITLDLYADHLTAGNAAARVAAYQVVVDCTDNLAARYVINDACVAAARPFVYGSVHRFEGQVAVFNHDGGPTYRCLFDENTYEPPACAELGVLGVLPGLVGTYQALEVIKLLTGIGTVLSGKLLVFNGLHGLHRLMTVPRRMTDLQAQAPGPEPPRQARPICETDRQPPAGTDVPADVYFADACFVDVSEGGPLSGPFPVARTRHIPLSVLAGYTDDLPRDRPVVLFCQSGRLSRLAAELLVRQYGLTNAVQLAGGLDAYRPAAQSGPERPA